MGTVDTPAPPRRPDPPAPLAWERAFAPPPPRRPGVLPVITAILALIAVASTAWAVTLHRETTRLAQENAALQAEVSTYERLVGGSAEDEFDDLFGFDPATARPLAPGAAVPVEGAGPRTFELTSSDGDLLIATVEPAAPDVYLELDLYDADGRLIADAWAEDVDAERLELHHLFVGDDPVYLVVSPYDGGDVLLAVEVVELGPAERVLDVELRVDELPSRHPVEVGEGTVLDVRLEDRSNGMADPLVTIHGPDGQLVAENDDHGETLDARVITVVEEGGTHTVVADTFWSDDPAATVRLTVDVAGVVRDAS
jgi:hypothetical protein